MTQPTIGIVGGESLLGREIRDVLHGSELKANIQLIGADEEEAGKLTVEGDEPAVITPLDVTNLASADLVILAGSAMSSRKAWDILQGHETIVVDATRALDDVPAARLCAPLVKPEAVSSPAIVAHSGAVALALFLKRLDGIVRVVADVFEPASELGQPGINELHQQVVKLLAFQDQPKDIYDAQLAFAMMARFGTESPHSLERMEALMAAHLTTLLEGRVMPSLRLIQAPVFHGYSMSIWVEFDRDLTVEAIEAAFSGEGVDLRGPSDEAPTNVGVAGQSGIAVGDIRRDRSNPRAFWFWLVADNLRLAAENAVKAAEQELL